MAVRELCKLKLVRISAQRLTDQRSFSFTCSRLKSLPVSRKRKEEKRKEEKKPRGGGQQERPESDVGGRLEESSAFHFGVTPENDSSIGSKWRADGGRAHLHLQTPAGLELATAAGSHPDTAANQSSRRQSRDGRWRRGRRGSIRLDQPHQRHTRYTLMAHKRCCWRGIRHLLTHCTVSYSNWEQKTAKP